ncbi:MAG TPA: flagellar biosynthetic protein FliO, partial [Rudaea sp.]
LGSAALNLIIVLALIFALAWVLKRLRAGAGAARGPLRVQASVALSMKERVVLIDAAGEHLLLGVSPAGVTCLHKFAAPPAAAAEPETAFSTLLRRVSNNKERGDAQ